MVKWRRIKKIHIKNLHEKIFSIKLLYFSVNHIFYKVHYFTEVNHSFKPKKDEVEIEIAELRFQRN